MFGVCVGVAVYLQVYVLRGEIEFLPRYVADQNQYLEVKYRDGRKENEPGYVSG